MIPVAAIVAATMRRASGPVGSVAITLPGSDLISPTYLFAGRRAMIGGTAARSWWAFTRSGETVVVDYAHNGSEADPTTFVAALSTATRVRVDLGSGAVTPAQQAEETRDALVTAGFPASFVDDVVSVSGASGLVIGPASDPTDVALRGMRGGAREVWGSHFSVTQNIDGGTGGTGFQYLGQQGANGRAIGAYIWAHDGFVPRLSVWTGPAYSTNPGELTLLGQAVVAAAIPDSGWAMVAFPAAAFSATDHLWVSYAEDDNPGSGPRLRAWTASPPGRGDFPESTALLWDTDRDGSNANAFGATYTPVIVQTPNVGIFQFFTMMGAIVELEDENGEYPADGAVALRIGAQHDNADRGARFSAGSAIIDPETTQHILTAPQLPGISVRSYTRGGYTTIATGDDSRIFMYGPWTNATDRPTADPPALLGDLGLLGLTAATAGELHTITLGTPVEIGTDAIGANALISFGANYVRTDGAPNTGLALDVWLDNGFTVPGTGSDSWTNYWTGGSSITDPWDDNILGASGVAPASTATEYRTTNTGMPHDSTAQTMPDPLVADPTDDNPAALAHEWIVARREGMIAA